MARSVNFSFYHLIHSFIFKAILSFVIIWDLFCQEVRLAIEYIVIPGGEPVELLPRCSEIVARQLELVESYQLVVENSGTDLNPRLQILPQKITKKSSSKNGGKSNSYSTKKPSPSPSPGTIGSRLPLLPE